MRTITFSGYRWNVHSSTQKRNPGPNAFSDDEENVSVHDRGLHLAITKHEKKWHCSELELETILGFGTLISDFGFVAAT